MDCLDDNISAFVSTYLDVTPFEFSVVPLNLNEIACTDDFGEATCSKN
jgi:hypothetical protein